MGIALFAEGITDHRFLDELLRRVVESVLVAAGHVVDIGPMQRLVPDPGVEGRAERIATGAEAIQGAFHLLFIHADGGGDPAGAHANNVAPGVELVRQRLGDDGRRSIGVIPVREIEAWALADGNCVCETFGTTLTPSELGIPNSAGEIEQLLDPKATLASALLRARPGRKSRRRPSPAAFLDQLGEKASMNELRELSAFAGTLVDLRQALAELGYVGVLDA